MPRRRAARCGSTGSPRRQPPAPPSLEYDDFPREVAKREIAVDEAAARIANALHLHLD